MDHREYIRIVKGSTVGVLMIHGIAGTPAHFRDLPPVIPEDWSVYNILLEGHGGTVSDFGAASMKKWKAQVNGRLEELLARHEKVLIVAHSMGSLFAIRMAVGHPDRIPALFLLAVPLRPWVRPSTLLTCLRVSRGNIRPEDRRAAAMQRATAIQLDRRLWSYRSWLPRFWELLVEIRAVRRLLPQLAVPCQAFQSQVDELVSIRSRKDLERHPGIRVTVLHDSGHFAYGEADAELLRTRLQETIQRFF